MKQILFAIVWLFATAIVHAEPTDIDAKAEKIVLDVGAAVSKAVQPHKVSDTHPVAKRVQAIFDRLQSEDCPKAHLTLADLSTGDEPAMAVGEDQIIIQIRFAEFKSDDAVAFTLAHELGHLAKRDTQHRLAVYLGSQKDASTDMGQLMHTSVNTADFSAMIRQQELRADAYGVALATRAGFDGLAGLKEAIGNMPADPDHPSGAQRVAAAEATKVSSN